MRAMEDTQSFRLIETMDTVEITPDHVDGQNIVYWDDIEQVFPGVKYVKDGKVAINMMRDSDGFRYESDTKVVSIHTGSKIEKKKSLKASSTLLHTL